VALPQEGGVWNDDEVIWPEAIDLGEALPRHRSSSDFRKTDLSMRDAFRFCYLGQTKFLSFRPSGMASLAP